MGPRHVDPPGLKPGKEVHMSKPRLGSLVLAVTLAMSLVTLAGSATAGASPRSEVSTVSVTMATLPQKPAGQRAARWLATQIDAKGYLVSPSGRPDLSSTAQAVLALAATGGWHRVAHRALAYLAAHIHQYVTQNGADGPGQLAQLILDAHALGAHPMHFGKTNLVARLLATMRKGGPQAGLFGRQSPTYNGAFRQGLSLAALAAAGVTKRSKVGPAIVWLQRQQCASGGWMAFRPSTSVACPRSDPKTYSGPDTNSTSLAVQGLVAQKAAIKHDVEKFLATKENPHAGWGVYGAPDDPNSTALVIQALLALKHPVAVHQFQRGRSDPVSALMGFQLKKGAFTYPQTHNQPNVLATEQALPALYRKVLPQ